MSKTKKVGFALSIVAILTFGSWLLANRMTSAEPLTVEEATNKVTELYKGDIVEVKESSKIYQITIKLDTGIYEVEIDKETGEVGKMTRMKKEEGGMDSGPDKNGSHPPANQESANRIPKEEESSLVPSPPGDESSSQEETPSQQQPDAPVKLLSEQEAISIAKTKVAGTVDDIEMGQTGGNSFYLVEIENEGTEQEATVQIHAISGEVMSITWDD